jgi:hypothetical protein
VKKILATALAAISGLVAFSVESRAEAADFEPAFAVSRAGGYIDLWPTKDSFATLFGAELQLRVARSVFLDMSFSGAYIDGDTLVGGRYKHAAYGNPTFGAHYAGEVTPRFHFFVGGTLAPPILNDPDSEVAVTAAYASQIRGYYDADRLWVGYLAVRAMAGIEWQAARRFYLRGEVRPVVFIRTNNNTGFAFGYGFSHDTDVLIEHAVEGEYRLDNGFGFGARFQAVITPSIDDAIQTMVEPFIALTPRTRGLYLRFGTPVALDRGLGFGLDRDKLATLRFSIGGQW